MMKHITLRYLSPAFRSLNRTVFTLLATIALLGANAQTQHVVISQAYAGGGNAGAVLRNDFVELFNPTAAAVDLDGWSVQYGAPGGTTWTSILPLEGTIAAGGYFLIQMASGGAAGTLLPTADQTSTINMGTVGGKVALVNGTSALSGSGCPIAGTVIDFLGYGTANCAEGTTAAAHTTSTSTRRNNSCVDTDNNSTDFATANPPTPRNSSTATISCYPVQLVVTSITPASPSAGTPFSVTVQARNAADVAQGVLENTTVELSTNGNAGPISGTITGVITQGTSSVTISGVVLSTEGTDVTITATRTEGQEALAPGTSAPFTVIGGDNTIIQFSTASGSALEADGTYELSVVIINPSPTEATSVLIALTSGSSARIGGFTSQTVTFPAGSSDEQVITLSLIEDEDCQGAETFTFGMENPTGGQGTLTIGTPSTHTFTMQDDDLVQDVMLARQYFDVSGADNWAINTGAGNVSTAQGLTDSPSNQRILTAPASWQVNNTTATLELAPVLPNEWTGMAIRARVASLSTTTGNGADNGDLLRFYVNVGSGFPGTADITIEGNNNARWGYTATGVATTTAGTPAYFQPASGGTINTGYSYVEIFIPGSPETIALRVVANNNATGEIWAVDNIELFGNTCPQNWYSEASGNMDDPIWSMFPGGSPGPAVINEAANVIIQSGFTVTAVTNTSVNDITVENGGTLVIADNTALTVAGTTMQVDGTLTTDLGTLALIGTRAVTLTGAAPLDLYDLTLNNGAGATVTGIINIRGSLRLTDGSFDATGAAVTLVSDADGTGRLGQVGAGADYAGELTIQRYIPEGATNWRMLGSPVEGATVEQWMDDFITAGFPGSHFPAFYDPPGSGILWPSIRWYDETIPSAEQNDGVTGVASAQVELTPGLGFASWSGDSLGGTAPFTIDVIGEPVIAQAPVQLPLTWTDSGNPAVDGFNLVSNPLPSPIAFSAIERGADVANTYYVYDPASGNHLAWSNGFGTGSADGIIRSSQGFWMKAEGPAATAAVEEADKVNVLTGGTFGFEEILVPMVRLRISSDIDQYSDESLIVFEGGSPAKDPGDAVKLVFAHPDAPQLATRSSDGHDLQIDFHGSLDQGISIPVAVKVPVSGTYRLNGILLGMSGLSCVSLEDLVTGAITPLNGDAEYLFAIEASADPAVPRFMLHATAPMPFSTVDVVCSGQSTGSAEVQLGDVPVDVIWSDGFGTPIQQLDQVSGSIMLQDLDAGSYMINVAGTGTVCGDLVHEFSINAPFELEAAVVSIEAASCDGVADGRLEILPLGGVAPYEILWSNGSDQDFIEDLPGDYSVTITDANGCTWTSEQLEIPENEEAPVAAFTAAEEVMINMPVTFTSTSINASAHAWNFGDGATSEETQPTHTYTEPGTYTVTLVVTGEGCTSSHSTSVVVLLSTSIAETAPATTRVWAAGDQIMIEHGITQGEDLLIEVLDATGRVHIQKNIAAVPGLITIPANLLPTGIWFVRIGQDGSQISYRVPLVR